MAEDAADGLTGLGDMDVMEVQAGLREVGSRLFHLFEPELRLVQAEPDLLPSRSGYELVDVDKFPESLATALKVWWGKRIEQMHWGSVEVWSADQDANTFAQPIFGGFSQLTGYNITVLGVGNDSMFLRSYNDNLRIREDGSLAQIFAVLLREFSDKTDDDVETAKGAYILGET